MRQMKPILLIDNTKDVIRLIGPIRLIGNPLGRVACFLSRPAASMSKGRYQMRQMKPILQIDDTKDVIRLIGPIRLIGNPF